MSRAEPSSPEIWVCHLGILPYRDALARQLELRERRLAGALPDMLLLLEHPPVYTRGRRSDPSELALGEEFYRARGIEVVQTDRGGRVTYHGPGQLVGYPIMAIADVGVYLRGIEAALIAALADFGVQAHSRCAEGADYTGVWVEDREDTAGKGARVAPARKIASIGVHLSRGVSTHGFAVNVDNDLTPFDWIVACGLPDVRMTSLAHELPPGRTLDADAFHERVAKRFCEAHGHRLRAATAAELEISPEPGRSPTPISNAVVPPFLSTRDRTSRSSPSGTAAACADATHMDHNTDTPAPVPRQGTPA